MAAFGVQMWAESNRILSLFATSLSPIHIPQIQAQLIVQNLHSNPTIAHHFINTCHDLRLLDSALLFFTQIPKPHVFVCNSLIRAFSHSKIPHTPLSIYAHMNRNSILPNNYTFPFLLKSLADFNHLVSGQSVHAHVVKLGYVSDVYVQNSLMDVYASCGRMGLCKKVFDEMPLRDVVSWTVLIMGYRVALMFDDALIAFEQMQYAGVEPNRVTMVNALAACASFGAIEMGIWIHEFVKRRGWEMDVILGTSLIDMYGKCGRIEEGLVVFQAMKDKNVYTWNALINGLALAKSGEEAIAWFKRMDEDGGVKADEVTLVAVLCACSHSGLVDIGRQIFGSMIDGKFGFSPGIQHYSCMVDLLARSGCIEESFELIKNMPFDATKAMWGSLLAGSRAQGSLEMSEFAARKLVEMEPENGAYYAVLSNICAEMGKWNEVEKVRKIMKVEGLKKDLGSSSVESFKSLPHFP
ncbi:pentatricopeptide repeat-containing protein At5g56310-like [Cucurbita pepo subsp. pepo]|uniref:pentatricopeptide repeat-containing protein At5g56310-like n=1 Tax=Cucurbita pepo subsp. pepo TaxID=3664 RepID=UPI000C9D83C2|nr:pentatricopeptide repeat-containing protein At5g56310-like [Cucurbita pepo subsp. pepo]XP_023548660.1 pentatricopeptide repeat-containing protein At5g56310-like [Cucurbita pepo subsp. pepo]